MRITQEEMRHIARLAEIDVPAGEAQAVAMDMSRICEYVEQLGEVSAAEAAKSFRAGPARAPLRPDVVKPTPLARPVEELAPEMAEGLFLVPRLDAMEGE